METPESFAEKRERFDSLDTIWLDGEFVDWEDATVHVLSHGLHYGTGIFEGVRCYDTAEGPALFRWEDHLDRFYQSAQPYDIEIPYTRQELTEATLKLIHRLDLKSCYIRPIAFYGYERLGLNPDGLPIQTAIAAWPWDTYLGEEALNEGIDVMVSSWRKYASSQIPTNTKTTGAYVNSVLAGAEARRNGYTEALLLNKDGNVAEGAGENLFLVRDGEIYTPSLSEGILEGVTRRSVVRIAQDLGYEVHTDVTISRGELNTADELFFTGTAAEVTPIKKIDNVIIGNGTKGPVTDEVQTRFFDVVKGDTDDYEEWFRTVTSRVSQ